MPSDTFAIQRDAALYVPRLASERAIALLRQKLFGTAGIVALVGPPGIGKSVVAERAARGVERKVTCVRLRLEARSCEELCAAVVAELETSGAANDPSGDQGESPAARMRSWVRSEAEVVRTGPERSLVELSIKLRRLGRPLALFIDDADGISDRAVVRLHELATSSRSIAICLVLSDEREFEGLPAKKLPVIRFDEPMSLAETTAYVNTRLMRGDTPAELRQMLDEAMIRRVHSYSGGIPRRVHAEVALLQRDSTARENARQDAASNYPVVIPDVPAAEPVPVFDVPSRARVRWLTLGAAVGSTVSALAALAVITFAPQLVLPRTTMTVAPASAQPPLDMPSDFEPGAPSVVSVGTPIEAEQLDEPPRRDEAEEPSSRLQAVAKSAPAPTAAPAPRPPTATQPPPRKPVGTEVASSKPAAAVKPAAPAEPKPAEPEPAPAAAPTTALAPEAAPAQIAKPQLFYADVNAVPRALITIDGVEIGQTPLGGLPLEEGIHQFRAVMPDGRVLERAILISKDRQRILFE